MALISLVVGSNQVVRDRYPKWREILTFQEAGRRPKQSSSAEDCSGRGIGGIPLGLYKHYHYFLSLPL